MPSDLESVHTQKWRVYNATANTWTEGTYTLEDLKGHPDPENTYICRADGLPEDQTTHKLSEILSPQAPDARNEGADRPHSHPHSPVTEHPHARATSPMAQMRPRRWRVYDPVSGDWTQRSYSAAELLDIPDRGNVSLTDTPHPEPPGRIIKLTDLDISETLNAAAYFDKRDVDQWSHIAREKSLCRNILIIRNIAITFLLIFLISGTLAVSNIIYHTEGRTEAVITFILGLIITAVITIAIIPKSPHP